jgi:hypothetical protein
MGDHFFNVLAIRTREPSEGNIFIPNSHLATLTEKPLDKLHLRAFSQVVGAGLEAETKHADSPFSGMQHGLNRARNMLEIARHHRFQQWQSQVKFFGTMDDGS